MSKVIIGFETTKEFKEKVIKIAKAYKIDGVPCPLTLSAFCRVAVEKAIIPVEGKWSK